MRKILAILFVFVSLSVSGQTTWYISPSGNDGTGTGTINDPWRTLYKACTDPSVSEGDNIYVMAGTYTISTQIPWPDGVSIIGEGMYQSIFNCSVSGGPAIKGESYGHSGDTNYGNQSISYCGFQGNMTGYQAIAINFRSNVEIHHCNFENFVMDGVIFFGQPKELWTGTNPYEPWKKMPSAWCSGNKFYNNIMTNNATYTAYEGRGNLRYGQQNGFECYNNTITQTARAAGSNGYGIKFYEEGWNRNTKMHDNTIIVAPRESEKFNFSIENWNDMGGCEYWNNTLQGQIDFTYTFDLINAGYGSWFHNNIVGFSSTPTNTEVGVTPEAGWVDKCIINNNIFRNLTNAIVVQHIYPIGSEHPNPGVVNNVQIYNNLIYNIGETSTGSRWTYGSIDAIAIADYEYNSGNVTDSVFIQNNTIVSSGIVRSNTYMSVGILIAGNQTFSNVRIRNNIIKGFTGAGMINAPIAAYGTQTNTNFLIQNNDFYGNGNNNLPLWDDLHGGQFSTGSGYSYTNNILTDPLFTSATDFRLLPSSGAIGTGQYVGIATDYLGNAYNNPPSMGCYEYVTGFTVPIVVTSDITDITTSTATGGGNVTNSGGITVTARGVCWSTSINPVVSDSHTSDGTGTGSFTSSITGLSEGVTYYVRAYATNSMGTAYGLNRTFTASATPVSVGVKLLKHSDGRLLIRNGKFLKRQ
jgi:hypothetical protein